MRLLFVAALLALAGACQHAPALREQVDRAAPLAADAGLAAPPAVVEVPGALHAVRCGEVTAVFAGTAPDNEGAPRSYGVESLAFVLADGRTLPFTPADELHFSDWRFDIFSPDCTHVALLTGRFGPYHVVRTADLPGYLSGTAAPLVVQAEAAGNTARVHSDALWKSGTVLEFYGSCCGTTDIYLVAVEGAAVPKKTYSIPTTGTVVRTPNGWEVKP